MALVWSCLVAIYFYQVDIGCASCSHLKYLERPRGAHPLPLLAIEIKASRRLAAALPPPDLEASSRRGADPSPAGSRESRALSRVFCRHAARERAGLRRRGPRGRGTGQWERAVAAIRPSVADRGHAHQRPSPYAHLPTCPWPASATVTVAARRVSRPPPLPSSRPPPRRRWSVALCC